VQGRLDVLNLPPIHKFHDVSARVHTRVLRMYSGHSGDGATERNNRRLTADQFCSRRDWNRTRQQPSQWRTRPNFLISFFRKLLQVTTPIYFFCSSEMAHSSKSFKSYIDYIDIDSSSTGPVQKIEIDDVRD
jgi:hypothetical protein